MQIDPESDPGTPCQLLYEPDDCWNCYQISLYYTWSSLVLFESWSALIAVGNMTKNTILSISRHMTSMNDLKTHVSWYFNLKTGALLLNISTLHMKLFSIDKSRLAFITYETKYNFHQFW